MLLADSNISPYFFNWYIYAQGSRKTVLNSGEKAS